MSDESALLREPWSNFGRQREAGKFGIWVFLASETLFFGALMLTYTVCRVEHPEAFAVAGRETNIWYGTINTAVLLTSSLTMAIAAQAAERVGTTAAARPRVPHAHRDARARVHRHQGLRVQGGH